MVKGSEATAKFLVDVLRDSIMETPLTKIGGLLAKPALKKIRSLIDPSEIGAAPLLGLEGLVLVGHGRSDSRAITSSLVLAHKASKSRLIENMRNGITANL